MGTINLANSANRDAVVTTASVRSALRVRWLDDKGRQASNVRFVKAALDCGIEAIKEKHGDLGKVAHALMDGDPEIDLETSGRLLRETSSVYIDSERRIAHKIKFVEIIYNPDGSVRERRPQKTLEPNVAGEVPLRWSGVFIDKAEACRKFVFAGKQQLQHINGLTYDFLYGMAKQLQDRNALMLLGAGPKSNQPLILRRGSTPYRGFLEGRVQGDKYCLLLHFSNMELKAPSVSQEPTP